MRAPSDMAQAEVQKRTPGPWAIKVFAPCGPDMAGDQLLAHAVVIDRLECTVAFTWHKAGEIDHTPHPNATLIAAAPEMLEALKLLLKESEGEFNDEWHAYCQEEARAAIAKAEGSPK